MRMDHPDTPTRAIRLHPWGLQVLGCALLWGALAVEVRAQSTTVTSPNAAFSRPEVTGLALSVSPVALLGATAIRAESMRRGGKARGRGAACALTREPLPH